MALISCPECGKQISDKAEVCLECGFPIRSYLEENAKKIEKVQEEPAENKCPYCGCIVVDSYCYLCNVSVSKSVDIVLGLNGGAPNENFTGIYKYTALGDKQEVYCPRCKSEDCSHYKEQKIIPGKTKTSYTANLNPFKPFTLVNKKEKVVKKEKVITENKFICNSCGKIFY